LTSITLAIDVASGDHGLATTIPAVLSAQQNFPTLKFILVGEKSQLDTYFQTQKIQLSDNVTLQYCTQTVEMGDLPSHALRNKKDSSMRVAINLVHEGKADAVVSSGNTGALMMTARFVLKMIAGIDRPAIIAALPTQSGKPVHMLDLGANVNCSAEQLLQFALMGSIACESIEQLKSPIVRLLNIGSEEIKGNDLVKAAAQLIQQNPQINYQGFIEADQIFHGETDVVVCDGFVGNSVLKASEGVARTMGKILKAEFNRSLLNKIRGLIARNVFKAAYQKLDPDVYNGSPLLGLKQIVIKSHGSANANAFYYAIKQAIVAVEQDLPSKIEQGLKSLH
jgi:glycerol-3-phosphate acyltransferase PlsX